MRVTDPNVAALGELWATDTAKPTNWN